MVKSLFANVRKCSFLWFFLFVLLLSLFRLSLTLPCLELVDVQIELFWFLFVLFFFLGSTIFLGFSGNSKPSWTKLLTSPAGQGLGLLEQFIPLQLEEYACHSRAGTVRRRDLELLKQTSKAH